MSRPKLVPTTETRPFWEGCAQGVLPLAHCAECGRISFPPRPRCPDCLSDRLDWIPLSATGTLKGRSTNHIARLTPDGSPVRVDEVSLAEESRATLLALEPEDICGDCPPDTPLRLGFDRTDPECPLLIVAGLGPTMAAGGQA